MRQRVDFNAVVGKRTELKSSGLRLTGRCPFHDEDTVSSGAATFSINPNAKIYSCDACGACGDVFHFVQIAQKVDFTEAVLWLAEMFDVQVEYVDS